jgi:DNA-binding NtrC family response regulator
MPQNKVLFSWLGSNDVKKTYKSDKLDGALAQAIELIRPNKIYLLNGLDHEKLYSDDNKFYLTKEELAEEQPEELGKKNAKESIDTYIQKLKQKMGDDKLVEKRISDFNPIDYRQITNNVIPFLKEFYKQTDKTYFLQTSGTPSTAVVWILLSQNEFPAELVQTSENKPPEIVKLPFRVTADFIPSEQDRHIIEIGSAEDIRIKVDQSQISMQEVYKRADRLALHNKVPVLILGESGTGKELCAKRIHDNSPRKDKRLVPINCGGLEPNLADSELFGHKKGAFTGAINDRDGAFKEANGGTLFLDEVGELKPDIQVKLLRVLQEGEIKSLGDDKTQKVNVRIIAATNRALMQEVAHGRFREDLFFRLAIGFIRIPPLHERFNDDVLQIAEEILDDTNMNFSNDKKIDHYTAKKFSESAKKLISQKHWRGNVRELQNTIQRACIWNYTAELTSEDIANAIIEIPNVQMTDNILGRDIGEGLNLDTIVEEVKKHYIQRARSMCKSQEEIASLFGITRPTVARIMKDHGIC